MFSFSTNENFMFTKNKNKNYIYLPFLKFSFTPIMSFAKKLNNDYYFELVADPHVACDKFLILIFYDCVII